MSRVPWHLLPSVELVRFKRIDFFPPRPESLAGLDQICLGTKTRTIGDALILSTLPEKLKALHPRLNIRVYPRSFNPVVFFNNPAVDGVDYLPERVYGDDSSWGEGHLIQLKETYFGVAVSDPPRPRIHLLPGERAQTSAWLSSSGIASAGRPIAIVHPWGHTWKNVATLDFWTSLIREWSGRVSFIQVGIDGHPSIPGCDARLLVPRGFRHARKLFSLVERASLFIGVNSGPMHVARAFDIPSLILTEQGDISRIFELRRQAPYFLHGNHAHAFLYEENRHLDVPAAGPAAATRQAGEFIEQAMARNLKP